MPNLHWDRPLARSWLRLAVGLFFVGAGLTKLVASLGPGMAAGPAGFAEYLAAAGVPFPELNAWLVCFVEIGAGLGVALGAMIPAVRRGTRLFALALAGDMAVAMATVGVRTVLGDPIRLGGVALTNEPYRLPLELGLFLAMAYLLWRPGTDARDRPVPEPAQG